ncbi:putative delta-60 repeat protein [Catenuloplanes nepalensis]|uniref:Delta-60 repeat protein n=1 Tax=Catenuloplanes nepalensis TaxID=587533 RepID=A0ABT9MRP8_9ACTN|nr:hypothetical protein [Catenuloplanes nepalensis]MDP9794102.1 putative delta-60 repeat protein [Catenuloplanes nepalensis]
MQRTAAVAAAITIIIIGTPGPAHAAPGALDPAFGTGGIVVRDTPTDDKLNALAALPGGATLAAGAQGPDTLLVRHLPDGTPDPAFGTGGSVVIDVGGLGLTDVGRGVAVQPDGRLLVAGSAGTRFAVSRFMADGTPDTSFGTAGTTLAPAGSAYGSASAVAVAPDGTVVVVSGGTGFTVARFLADGTPDTSFGTAGVVSGTVAGPSPNGGGSPIEGPSAVVVQPDGGIVVGGTSGWNYGRHLIAVELTLVRYLPSGARDPSFGNGGVVRPALTPGGSSAHQVLLRPDGRIVAVGAAGSQPVGGLPDDVVVAQYLPDGTPDPAFGTGGVTYTDVTGAGGDDAGTDAALLPDGSLVVGGYALRDSGPSSFLAARYTPTGTLDPSFGTGGVVADVLLPGRIFEQGLAVAVHPSGPLVIGGKSYTPATLYDLTLAAYQL